MDRTNFAMTSYKQTTVQTFFEVSPVRKVKSAPSGSAKMSMGDVEEEKPELVLKPFAAKPRIVFKGVLVGSTKCQSFLITNPDSSDLAVEITVPDCFIQVESSHFHVPAKSSIEVNLTWSPQEKGTFSESIHVKDSKGRRGMVSLALEALVPMPKKGLKKSASMRPSVKGPPTVKSRVQKPVPLKKAKPAWQNSFPSDVPREVLKPVLASAQQTQPWNNYETELPVESEPACNTPLRRETFLVSGKENDGSPALPKTPAFGNMSADSLDMSPKVKSTTKRLRHFKTRPDVQDLLREFMISPQVNNLASVSEENSILESRNDFADFDPTLPSISEIETPSFEARRCSTAFKQLSAEMIRKPKGVSPRELFQLTMHQEVPESRLSSATYIADRRESNETYVADRRVSNETYVAEGRLSTDTYVLGKLDSFEGASGDLTVLQNLVCSPGLQPLAAGAGCEIITAEKISEAWETKQTGETSEVDMVDVHIPLDKEVSGNSPQCSENGTPTVDAPSTPDRTISLPDPALTYTEKKSRKRFGSELEYVQFQLHSSLDQENGEDLPRYNLRSSGKVVHVQEVQSLASVTMDISPPKKFKLPTLGSTEKCSNQTFIHSTQKADKTFVLTSAASALYIPFGTKKKLILEKPASSATNKQTADVEFDALPNTVDDILMDFAMAKMSTPGLLEDPFYMNPLLNDAILNKFEIDFKKWLNSVLTPPEELESNDLIKVNAAEMWAQSTKTVDTSLAPSKEMVSSKYLSVKSRLDQLRHAAYLLFSKHEMKTVLCCVNSRVDSGNIKIRQDKALHIDQGLKHGVLNLFMSYNPLWLRIGLETVCGTLIPMRSNTDVQTLSYFLITRILSPEAVVGKSYLLLKDECRQKYNRFVVKKFLMLVYFLDKAKCLKLIRHDPCLFLKNSTVKTSKDMLTSFSRMVLAGEGDITKHLGYMGYKVSHVQGYLDEFKFSVEHLGVDLRDGVRLVRVVELVTGSTGSSAKLRVPAISRLQKIHNVELALKRLEANGFSVKNLTAQDIVMGHREKTLSLIWQIIHGFQVPRFNKAALVIQRWWLRPSLRTAVHRRIQRKQILHATVVFQKFTRGYLCRKNLDKLRAQIKNERLRTRSATVIQRACRQFFLKRRVALMARRYKENEAARKIQSAFRMYKARGVLLHLREEAVIEATAKRETAAMKIQASFRRVAAQRKLQALKFEYTKKVAAALKIQCFWRQSTAIQKLQHLKAEMQMKVHAAKVLQSIWRMKKAQAELKKLKKDQLERQFLAASVVQRSWRCYTARKMLQLLRLKNEQRRTSAALTLQAAWRCVVARRLLQELRLRNSAAIKIQCAWKCLLATRILHKLTDEEHKKKANAASTKIQCAWRCLVARRVLQQLKADEEKRRANAASTKIQCAWRCFKAREALAHLKAMDLDRKNSAASKIQCFWLSYVAQKELARLKFLQHQKREAGALTIQCAWKSYLARKIRNGLRLRALQNSAALTIQCSWRRFAAKKLLAHLVQENIAKGNAATTIQCSWRCFKARQELETLKREAAALVLQCSWRSFVARQILLTLKTAAREAAALKLQCSWRSYSARRTLQKLKEEFEQMRAHLAAVKIQTAWRCYSARQTLARLVEEDIERKTKAATLVQKRWRGKVARRYVQQMKRELEIKRNTAATVIQCTWKCFAARKALCQLREEHDRRRSAATKIQCFWRRASAQKTLEHLKVQKFNRISYAATVIQLAWRGFAKLRHEKRTQAALRIQTFWRMKLAMKELAELKIQRFVLMSSAATLIKSYWRRHVAMKQLTFLKAQRRKNAAALKIQLFWKRYIADRELSNLKQEKLAKLNHSAEVIQCAWRCFLARRILLQLRELAQKQNNSVIKIQRAWRRHAAQKRLSELKSEFARKQCAAATRIQCAVRSFLAKRVLLRLIHKKRSDAAIKLQSQFRRLQAVRELSKLKQEQLEKRKGAAVTIQKFFRGQQARLQVQKIRAEVAKMKAYEVQNKAAFKLQNFFRILLWQRAVATTNLVRKELIGVETELGMWERILLQDDATFLSFRILLSVLRSQRALRNKHHLYAKFIQQKWRTYYAPKMKAATKIQALWRGYKCREKIRQAAMAKKAVVITDHQVQQEIKLDQKVALQLVKKCDQIQEASKNVTEEQTVGYKILYALQNWQKTFDFEIGTYTLFNGCLEASGSLVMLILPGIPMVVEGFLGNNRSVPAMKLAVLASEILLSVVKFPEALPDLKKVYKMIDAVLFNLKVSTANDKLFLNCCTILWVLAHDEEMKKKILSTKGIDYQLRSVKPKEGKQTRGNSRVAVELPSLKLHKQPRCFSNKQHAYQALIKKLGMQP
ncbi:abnormal spindle-like microcephaly-associated protein homolog [Neocloeon triangulifer]|uniref:abnormal spindle-like microcephaly-associated protein homolog n=1 Tax=Neocloeon triangulifer TaxID=2078957 RepID=UPI00286F8CAF|nr:abnormal spindle-like microcephaly-associated protein homolog [Neocloeon triangulifer]XP_059488355.1 abnormal spindle-like microcephaly-associated protein homolog [Neocloeon triangulifer]